MAHVIKTMQDNLQDDPFFAVYKNTRSFGQIGSRWHAWSKIWRAGFYKKVGKDILRLDFASGEYVPVALRQTIWSAAS